MKLNSIENTKKNGAQATQNKNIQWDHLVLEITNRVEEQLDKCMCQ